MQTYAPTVLSRVRVGGPHASWLAQVGAMETLGHFTKSRIYVGATVSSPDPHGEVSVTWVVHGECPSLLELDNRLTYEVMATALRDGRTGTVRAQRRSKAA